MKANNLKIALQAAYSEAKEGGLIALTKQVRAPRGQYSLRREKLLNLFQSLPLWDQLKTRNGHAKFKHRLSHIPVGFQTHGNSEVDPGIAVSLLEAVQDHLNFLGNNIFGYKTRNWKKSPDFKAAERNYQSWKQSNCRENFGRSVKNKKQRTE